MAHTVHTVAELTELECLIVKHANLPKLVMKKTKINLTKAIHSVFEAENIIVLIHCLLKGCSGSFPQFGDAVGIVLYYQR